MSFGKLSIPTVVKIVTSTLSWVFYCANHSKVFHTAGELTWSALLLRRTYLPSRSTSSTVTRPLAEACWAMRVRVTVPPITLDASLSVSFRRRFLALALPEELRLLLWTMRVCAWEPEPEERVTVTRVGGGLGDSRSLGGSH